MTNWFDEKLGGHAPSSGETLFGKDYKPGEFLPFYVPRPDMPQIDDIPALIKFITSLGYRVSTGHAFPTSFKFHQRVRWNPAKVGRTESDRPILVSADRYILDGNHRDEEHLRNKDKPIKFVKIHASFEEAIAALYVFPETTNGKKEN